MGTGAPPLTAKLQQAYARLQLLPWAWRLIWAAAPRWTLAWAALLLAQAGLATAQIALSKPLVDSLAAAGGTGGAWEQLRQALLWLALMVVAMLAAEAAQSGIDWLRTGQAELVQDYIKGLIHEQAVALDLAFYESSAYYDQLEQARSDAGTRPLALLDNVGGLVQNGLTLLAMMAILAPYGLWLPLVLLLGTLPALYTALYFNRRFHAWWQRTTADRRRAQYYETLVTHAGTAAEVRLFGLGHVFRATYQALRARLRSELLTQLRQQSLARLGASASALLIAGGATAWMLWRTLQGTLTLGDLALFYQAVQRGQGLMRALLSNLGQIYANTLFLGNLSAFLALTPRIATPPQPVAAPATLTRGVRFDRVTFRYPGSARPALQDFSLFLPAGQVVAIVGANGAGKSTLVKLLCRLYDPQAGRIEFDGIDIRQLPLDELRRLITVLFQLPVTYQETAGQNIALGDLPAAPGPAAIEDAARRAGIHDTIARLPRGYETHLGKLFGQDDVELSGGEWQRLAMARAFLRRAPLILLDEPTSFMDPWAEADWFDRLRALARGRTAIVITHRFTIARRADIIYVMDEGQIKEAGSHDQLVARGGRYAQSWAAQMTAMPSDASRPNARIDGSNCPVVSSFG
jgi:ATP-binding cassette subfamily B protein